MVLKPLLLLLAGCLKQPPAVPAATNEPVALAALLSSVDDGGTAPAADEVLTRLSAVVQARNLSPRAVQAEPLAKSTTGQRRLELLAEAGAEASLLVLVESSARFFSQMNGQYRWTVEVRLHVVPRARPEAALTDAFEVPVFLIYDHEGEAEALVGALPVIERRLGLLLDQHNRAAAE